MSFTDGQLPRIVYIECSIVLIAIENFAPSSAEANRLFS